MGLCETCDHPADWHRLDDSHTSEMDPSAKFPCIGYDCEADDFDRVNLASCSCQDFKRKGKKRRAVVLQCPS